MVDKFFETDIDFRKQIGEGYPYYVCTKCGFGLFILTQPLDTIFPDIICGKCGNVFQELEEGVKNGEI